VRTKDTRIVTSAFSGLGIVGVPGSIWVIDAGVTAPPALLKNSVSYDGPLPHDPIRFDAEQAELYRRLNTPRREPVPEPLLTAEQIQQRYKWSAKQFGEARTTGFPAATSRRDILDGDGIPIGYQDLWRQGIVDAYFDRLTALASAR